MADLCRNNQSQNNLSIGLPTDKLVGSSSQIAITTHYRSTSELNATRKQSFNTATIYSSVCVCVLFFASQIERVECIVVVVLVAIISVRSSRAESNQSN